MKLRALIREIADAYESMPNTPTDPLTVAAWTDLGNQCRADAWTIVAERLHRYHVADNPEPYAAAELMHDDVLHGRFIVSRANSTHPLWTPGTNVAFRTAHDVLGHCDARSGFDWTGELAACAAHGRWLASPGARRALFVECVMQTGTAIYRGGFPEQKVNAFPERFMAPDLQAAFAQWLDDPATY